MEEKSLFNMIISIITSVCIIPLLVLGIVFTRETLPIIFMSIYYPIIGVYYILRSIYFGKEESTSKTVLYRLSNIFRDLGVTLITISFILLLTSPIKWILLGLIIFFYIIEVLLDSFDKLIEVKYLLFGIKAFTILFSIFTIYQGNPIIWLEIASIVICYTSNLLGNVLKNKILLSFEGISLILFGIFLILI